METEAAASDAYAARAYNHTQDNNSVSAICENVFDNHDYLPRSLEIIAKGSQNCPVVLAESASSRLSNVVAFVNVRALDTQDDMEQMFVIEAVRVDPELRGRRLGRQVVEAALKMASNKFNHGEILGHVRKSHFTAVTLRSNVPMVRILTALDFTCFADFPLWSFRLACKQMKQSAVGNMDLQDASCSMLDIIGVHKHISQECYTLLDTWEPIFEFSQFADAIQGVWKANSSIANNSIFLPLYFQIDSVPGVWKQVAEGNATAWMLRGYDAVVVVFDNGFNYSNNSFVLVLVSTVHLAEAAMLFVDRRLSLKRFAVNFGATLTTQQLKESSMLSSGITSFAVFHSCTS